MRNNSRRSSPTRSLTWLQKLAIGVGMISACVVGTALGIDRSFTSGDMVTQGVSVVGSPIGGLTFAQAANKLTASITAPSYVRLVATSDSSPMNLPASSIGLKYDATRALYEAQAIGRTGSILQRFIQRRQVATNGRDIQLHVSFNKGALAWVLKHTAS
ncbi:MAG: peptidoglycan binding domain-containing protein, partial [Armatimonadota bacterium]